MQERFEADLNSPPTKIEFEIEHGEVTDVTFFFGTHEPWRESEFDVGTRTFDKMVEVRSTVEDIVEVWNKECNEGD